jgi:hypothetical protein
MMNEAEKPKRGGSVKGRKVNRLPLLTLSGVIREAGRIYGKMRRKRMPHEEGRSLIWALSQIRAMIEAQALETLEARMSALQRHAADRHGFLELTSENMNGHESADRQIVAAS